MNFARVGIVAAAVVAAPVVYAIGRALLDDDEPRPADAAPEAPAGMGTSDLRSHVTGPLSYAITDAGSIASVIATKIDDAISDPTPIPRAAADDHIGQARAGWAALDRAFGHRGDDGMYDEYSETPLHIATVWPLGQVLAGALDVAHVTGDYAHVNDVVDRLDQYWYEGSYAQSPVGAANEGKLWDDNAWVMLDLTQAYEQTGDREYLAAAERLVPWMEEGLHPDGGVYWQQDNERMTRNTCAGAPTEQAFLRLYLATRDERYLTDARAAEKMRADELLLRPDGLWGDNIGDDGAVDRTVYSYNQGTPVGADLLWYRVTGEEQYLDRAQRTVDASIRYFSEGDRLWSQAPAFNAIYFRNLLAYDQVRPDPRIREMLTSYLERAGREALDVDTGLYTGGGIGRYGDGDGSSVIDQAAFVQMHALLDWDPAELAKVG